MDAYIYQAALLCAECAANVLVADGGSFDDSDHSPQGPYLDGGGEADCPQHCDYCGLFLENPLTGDGEQYVIAEVKDTTGSIDVLQEWREFYDYLSYD